MSKSPSDPAIPPPLAAIGGWSDAAWFSPSILTDAEVVGFAFPKLPGGRKQNFHVTDRSAVARPAAKVPGTVPARPPKRLAGKLAAILEGCGATRAVACCRSKFLFESAPVLFFADIPMARLKPKAATALRRAVIENGLRCCLLSLDGATATAMFWAAGEDEITDFVLSAEPEYRLHAAFDTVADAAAPRGAKQAAAAAPARRDAAREKKLLQEITALREQVEVLRRAQSALGAMEQLGLDDARLKSMLKLLHPDKHGGSEAAHEAATWLNGLRELLKGKPG